MKVRLTVDLNGYERYVIARYFGHGPSRASRQQARAFVQGAVRSAVRERADAMRGRQRATARRLAAGDPEPAERPLRDPEEKQLNLLAGV